MANPLLAPAISWGFSAAGWLISPLLSRFLNECFDALGLDPPPKFQSRKQILLTKLEQLHTTLLPKLLILTDAAEKSIYQPVLEKWIQKLKLAFYEAEYVLSLIEYRRLRKEVNSLYPSPTCAFNLKNLKCKLPKFHSEKKNLIKSLEKLEEIVNEAMGFIDLLFNLPSSSVPNSTWTPRQHYRVTISNPSCTVIGRDKDMKGIVELLRKDFPESSSDAKCYSVIGIWGMGGIGKTTLAQYVCDYEKEAKYFDCVVWVHVSQNFNVHGIMKCMWESLLGNSCPNYDNLDVLISKIADEIRRKKYFLVLDDVWCDQDVSEQELNQLFAPLRYGKPGSKILVTTRNEHSARVLGSRDPIKLRELEDEHLLSLFMSRALSDVEVNEDIAKELRRIGVKIVEKLCRSPLAAITVASQLQRRPYPQFWQSILNRRFLNDVMGALYLSYHNLHPALQRCFAFCSLFPKGHLFVQDDLVDLWIAEGFIETEDSKEHIKDIANLYFQELVYGSFFQVDKRDGNRYTMHDLIHDLAEHISQGECFKIERDEQKEIPIQTRHLYVASDMLEDYVKKICKLKDLRTIIVLSPFYERFKEVDLDAIFMNNKKLYVVDLQYTGDLPKSVIHLKNLRYLKIHRANTIPKTLNKIYQLRVLQIGKGYHSRGNQIEIPDVGRLILLQNLREFHVRPRKGFELKQLEHLTNLFGSLYIYDLHNVEKKEDASQVNLWGKNGLKKLSFNWDYRHGDSLRDVDVEILDSLCPPPEIKEVTIKEYSGNRLPCWILENHNKITCLEHLELVECKGLKALQRINELSDLLSLTLSHLPRLTSWGPLPSNLTQLELSQCSSLAFALKEDLEIIMSIKSTQISHIVTSSNNCKCKYYYRFWQFSHVREMIKVSDHIDRRELSTIPNDLKGCLEKRLDLICQLREIYGTLHLPPALQKLTVGSCIITDRVLAGSMQALNYLTHMTLEDIITITCITKEVLSSMTSLMFLSIKGCLLLTSIGGWDNHNTLEKFELYCCPNLTLKASIVANSSNTVEQTSSMLKFCLSRLVYYNHKTVEQAPSKTSILKFVSLTSCMLSDDIFQNLVSLDTLKISDCSTIMNPHIGYLKSLTNLEFCDCPNLISLVGSSELNHLKELEIIACKNFENYSDADKLNCLKKLTINRFCQLEQLISKFSSLISLTLSQGEEEYFSQEECEVFSYLSSLEIISFYDCKMHMLPNLSGLQTLRTVDIYGCVNLTSLSEFPPSVHVISIRGCNNSFTESLRDENGPNWQKISHIPEKSISR